MPDTSRAVRAPATLLVFLILAFFAFLVGSAPYLPPRIASHFDMHGQPDGWMSRSTHLLCMALLGLGLPLLFVLASYSVKFLPTSMINLPHRDYWLAPERRAATSAFLLRHCFWLASLSVCFAAGLHFAVTLANRHEPPRLSNPLIFILAGAYVLLTIIWLLLLFRHFRRHE